MYVYFDHIKGVKVHLSGLFAKRDALCPFRELKAPVQIGLHESHLLLTLIIFLGSKFILAAYFQKGTHCVPFGNKKPQGKFD